MDTKVLEVANGARHLTDLTAEASAFCRARGDGLLHVFAPHATCGLALMELGSGSDVDLDEVLARLLPRDDRWVHAHGARGHGADHLLPVFVSPSMVLPVLSGAPALGTWQSLVLVDLNGDNPRRSVRFSFVAG